MQSGEYPEVVMATPRQGNVDALIVQVMSVPILRKSTDPAEGVGAFLRAGALLDPLRNPMGFQQVPWRSRGFMLGIVPDRRLNVSRSKLMLPLISAFFDKKLPMCI